MSEWRQEEAWGRVSFLIASIANIHRKKGRKPYTAANFNPFAKSQMQMGSIEDLKVFLP